MIIVTRCLIDLLLICRFEISVGPSDGKGIFLRRGFLDKPEEFNVNIQPKFMTEKYYGKSYFGYFQYIYLTY